jgi:hypothetical protein
MWNPLVEKQAMKARLRENCLHLPSHYIRDNERGKTFSPSRERANVKADVGLRKHKWIALIFMGLQLRNWRLGKLS